MLTTEIAIIGAGPAGLSAALYAARYLRKTLVVHDGQSRALQIPKTHNLPGHPDGIKGRELVDRMAVHAERYGAIFTSAKIITVRKVSSGFELEGEGGERWTAASIILATGVVDNRIDLDDALHQAAIDAGVLRYCPICDGYEHRGQRIGIVGASGSGAAEALFLRQFADDISILTRTANDLTDSERGALLAAGIRTFAEPITQYVVGPTAIGVTLASGQSLQFDVLYGALGSTPRSHLASDLGIALEADGAVRADAPLGTMVPGVFGPGDVVDGLDQITVAIGHGAVAATRAHNWLRE